ncbi:J domain-containing protein [Glutamicibacter sp. X7]
MSTPSPYEILGVSRTATLAEIKVAYRKAARSAHPDLGGSAEQFKLVQHAYQVLSDEHARESFDRSYGASQRYPGHQPTESYDDRLRGNPAQPKASLPIDFVPPLGEPFSELSVEASKQRVHGVPRKRGLFTSRARLEREAAVAKIISNNVLSVLPAARLVNGLHAPGREFYDHVVVAGYRMAVINSMTVPEGYYHFDGQILRHGTKMTQPPKIDATGLQHAFMEMNVASFTVVLSSNRNVHEPVIEYARNAEPAVAATSVVNAASLVRELKLFLGSGPMPNVVDRSSLARLLGGMY